MTQLFGLFTALLLFVNEASTVGVSDFQSIITALTTQVNVSTIVAVIAAVVAITVGIAFMWWGARYASKKIMASIKKGKTGA